MSCICTMWEYCLVGYYTKCFGRYEVRYDMYQSFRGAEDIISWRSIQHVSPERWYLSTKRYMYMTLHPKRQSSWIYLICLNFLWRCGKLDDILQRINIVAGWVASLLCIWEAVGSHSDSAFTYPVLVFFIIIPRLWTQRPRSLSSTFFPVNF